MELLNPDWNQAKPTFVQARAICQQVPLEIRSLNDPRLTSVLDRIRETHANGGALFASFHVGPGDVFDWFASRNRLLEFGVLRQLLDRVEVRSALPVLKIQPATPEDPAFVIHRPEDYDVRDQGFEVEDFELGDTEYDGNFRMTSSFVFDGELAQKLYYGGAYTSPKGDGRAEKESSLALCEALFGLRFSEISHFSSHSAWTPWFENIGLDWTAILFDRRARALSILAVTDTD
jgi:hypothetical protein